MKRLLTLCLVSLFAALVVGQPTAWAQTPREGTKADKPAAEGDTTPSAEKPAAEKKK